MPIPESQLVTWSHQGSVTQSSTTYATIKRALEAADVGYADKDFKIFLQGSYGNATNIYSESDVDVVIRLDSMFHHDLDDLPSEQRAAFEAVHSDATYANSDFKAHVLSALKKSFGQAVKPGQKAIKIAANAGRRDADVLIANEFRRYHRFSTIEDQEYDSGICFFTSTGERVANYPRQHSANCTLKHQATNGWYKPMVRILKNMRGKLVDDRSIAKDLAPSYFIEGLLYNVPNGKFGGSYSQTFVDAINWILEMDRSKFVCANEQYYLLRDSSVTWPSTNCDRFLDELTNLWNGWQ